MTDMSAGARLREARLDKGFSIEDVAVEIKVSEKVLQAIEEGDFDNLPANVYTHGFIRLYAEHVGIQTDEIGQLVKRFATERAASSAGLKHGTPERIRPVRAKRSIRLSPRALMIIATSMIGVAVLLYLLFSVRGYTRPPDIELLSPPENSAIEDTVITVKGIADATAEVEINGERTYVDEDGTFEEEIGVRAGLNTIRVKATSIGGGETVITRTVLVEEQRVEDVPVAVEPEEQEEEIDVTAPFTLTVRAGNQPAWLYIEADGSVAYSGTLEAGASREIQGLTIRVTSGNGNHTYVALNGGEEAVLSPNPGVVRDVLFTRDPETGIITKQVDSSL